MIETLSPARHASAHRDPPHYQPIASVSRAGQIPDQSPFDALSRETFEYPIALNQIGSEVEARG
jgi:hypothetical protein